MILFYLGIGTNFCLELWVRSVGDESGCGDAIVTPQTPSYVFYFFYYRSVA